MLKIKEYLQHLLCTQEKINNELRELNKNLKPKTETWSVMEGKLGKLEHCLETNVYTKDETVEAINKEIDYNKRLEKIKNECPDMLQFIEVISTHYANMDKYNILATTEMFASSYELKRKEN